MKDIAFNTINRLEMLIIGKVLGLLNKKLAVELF